HDYESRYYRILEKAERDLHRYRQTRSQRPLPPGNEPNKPSSPSFWNRFLPTLLLSLLLSLAVNHSLHPPAARELSSHPNSPAASSAVKETLPVAPFPHLPHPPSTPVTNASLFSCHAVPAAAPGPLPPLTCRHPV
ncbi:MAG: hypothetical protein IT166_05860, partial [Bryobacterales bacterium]|nr:hypothetical protein [Bryobacterales bacterium]